MPNIRIHTEDLTSPIKSLEEYFGQGGVSIVQAAFAHSYFVDPNAVRARTPYYRDRVRYSREHYPELGKGELTAWPSDGRPIRLDDNQYAQNAWVGYTQRALARRSGYGLRHIWGNTHNPDAFTAGWNFCYMPFWAGMLTEDQHPHPELQKAIRQASWDLYFADDPVCQPPDFVENPGLDLASILREQPLLILRRDTLATIIDLKVPNRAAGHDATLPITLEPSPPEVFKNALLRTKKAWMVVTYQDGSVEVRPWNAERISITSNIIGNLRSRPEFRAGAWQNHGISSLLVSIEQPQS